MLCCLAGLLLFILLYFLSTSVVEWNLNKLFDEDVWNPENRSSLFVLDFPLCTMYSVPYTV